MLTLEFVLPPVNDDEDLILEEENLEIYAHLENVLVHMIDAQDIAIFGIYILCTNVASLVSHILLRGLYMQHYTCAKTDLILYMILKDNASYAYCIYNCKNE